MNIIHGNLKIYDKFKVFESGVLVTYTVSIFTYCVVFSFAGV